MLKELEGRTKALPQADRSWGDYTPPWILSVRPIFWAMFICNVNPVEDTGKALGMNSFPEEAGGDSCWEKLSYAKGQHKRQVLAQPHLSLTLLEDLLAANPLRGSLCTSCPFRFKKTPIDPIQVSINLIRAKWLLNSHWVFQGTWQAERVWARRLLLKLQLFNEPW